MVSVTLKTKGKCSRSDGGWDSPVDLTQWFYEIEFYELDIDGVPVRIEDCHLFEQKSYYEFNDEIDALALTHEERRFIRHEGYLRYFDQNLDVFETFMPQESHWQTLLLKLKHAVEGQILDYTLPISIYKQVVGARYQRFLDDLFWRYDNEGRFEYR